MKYYIISIATLALTLGLAACSEETEETRGAQVGDVVNFGISNRDVKTYYGTDGEEQWQINWNFNEDQVRIFSKDAYVSTASAGSTSDCAYTVTEKTSNETTTGWLLPVTDGTQLHWGQGSGAKGENTFYATYPADNQNVSLISHEQKNDSYAVFEFPIVTEQEVAEIIYDSNGNTILKPDMKNQFMVARAKASRGTSTVTFHFQPIMTTLECTLTRSPNAKDDGNVATRTLNITGISLQRPIGNDFINEAHTGFYYRVGTQSTSGGVTTYSNTGLCTKDGILLTTNDGYSNFGSDYTSFVTSQKLDNPIALYSGRSLTFTIFLPPYYVGDYVTISGQTAAGKSFSLRATVAGDVDPSAGLKKKVTLPTLDY